MKMFRGKTGFLVSLVLAVCSLQTAYGQSVFLKYGPVAGIQKSTGATYQNTAAASADVIGLWSGCSGANFLRGDGTCAVPAGTGVTSVSQTVPAGFAVTGSPVTGSGTLAISYATGQTANRVLATPDGTTGALSLRALVAGDIPPINLGSTANGGVSSATILLGTNGGTSNGFFSVTGPTTALRTFTFPNASATVLTSNAAVTVPQGGTGLATLTANGVLLGEGTSNVSPLVMGADTILRGTAAADPVAAAVPNCGSSTTALNYSTSTHAFGCQTIVGAGGNPAGSTTQMQYNNSSAFGGTAGLTWDNVNNKLTLTEASAGADYFNILSSNTTFIGMSMGVSTGHTYAMRASTGGFFIADSTNGTNPISFDSTGAISFAPTVSGTTVLSIASTSTASNQSVNVNVNSSHEPAVVVNASGTAAACLTANASAGVGQCSMPAGHYGLATQGSLSLFSSNGLYFTNSIPLNPTRVVWASVTGNGTGCTVNNSVGLTSTACSRSAAGAYTLTPPSGFSNNASCVASGLRSNAFPAAAEADGSSSTIGITVFNSSTGAATDGSFNVSCMSST